MKDPTKKRYKLNKIRILINLLFFIPIGLWAYNKDFNFIGLSLGQTRAQTMKVIASNKNLRQDRGRYLGLINEAEPFTLKIKYGPVKLLNRIFIQYFEGKSYEIILLFNQKYYDFYTLTERMEDKYGEPVLKTAHLVRWKHDSREEQISLEAPGTFKIINIKALRKLEDLSSNRINIFKQTNHTSAYSNSVQLLNEF